MKWQDLTSVSLPAELTVADILGVVAQIEQQFDSLRSGASAAHGVSQRSDFPRPVMASLMRLLAQRDALQTLESQRAPATPAGDPVRRSETNSVLDDGWRAFEGGLDGASYLTDGVSPGRVEAKALHGEVFGVEGLRFVNLRPRRQWDASTRRLATLEATEGLDDLMTALGLTRHLAALRAAHVAFGEAHGFLAPQQPGRVGVTDTRSAQVATEAALRDFLLKVSAQADADDPESEVWVGYVLVPYAALLADLARSGAVPPRPVPVPGVTEPKPPIV